MIYKVTQKDIREDNPSIDAIEAFAACTSRELKYVVLTYDYDSPFKELSFEDRANKAAREAGYHVEKGRDRLDKTGRKLLAGGFPRVEEAIFAFKGIRRDLDRETLEAYDIQLEEINQFLKKKKETDKEWDITAKLMNYLPKLLAARKNVIDLLNLKPDYKEELIKQEDDAEEAPHVLTALERRNKIIIERGE